MDILVIDVGGTSVKLRHTADPRRRKFKSGDDLIPQALVDRTKAAVRDWEYDVIALGLPCRINGGRAVDDPPNLGPGWVGYDFAAAFERPVRIMNDACLQALGSYDGGRMLFLSLGTAVGSALVCQRLIVSLDLGQIRLHDEPICDVLGKGGLARLGRKRWQASIHVVVPALKSALLADYVVLGGGQSERLDDLPEGVRRGHNRTVAEGGRRLWDLWPEPQRESSANWIIL